jgi:hypothetical protein
MSILTDFYNFVTRRRRKAVRIILRFGRKRKKHHYSTSLERSPAMADKIPFSLPDTMEVPFTATYVDILGNPTTVINPTAAIDNTNIATVVLNSVPEPGVPVSSISGLVIAAGPIGTALLTISGTNPDGTMVTVVQTINVVTSFAGDIVIVFGTPIPIPPPPTVFGMPMPIPPTAPSTTE